MLTKSDLAELEAAKKNYQPRNRSWTKAEIELVGLYYKKVPVELLAKKLGRTISSVQTFSQRVIGKT